MDAGILTGLNTEQMLAVTSATDKSILVLAGAGSGKTRVLTTRVAWLIQHAKVDPGAILAVTFTNKAAKEMQNRVANMLGCAASTVWIGTFHSIALRILSKHHKEALLPSYFQILDSQDQLSILRRLIRTANLDEERYTPRELQKFINNQKEAGLRANAMVANGLRQEHWINLYADYEGFCNNNGLVDFTELLLRVYELLSTNEEVLKLYRQQFRQILIDEFQDTNQLQYRWLQLIASNAIKLFAVGDDDQSIYAFRGAKATNLQAFLHDFKVEKPILLEQNYRSTPSILTAANAVISNNTSRIGKDLWTDIISNEKIHLYEAYTEEDEAYFVADEINTLRGKGVELSEIAVLYRSNAQSRLFEQFFCNRGIPYKVYGGQRFFDRQEVKHVLAYLRLIINNKDEEAFLRVVNFPARGIGAVTLKTLQDIAKEKGMSLFDACSQLSGRNHVNLAKFTTLISALTQGVDDLNLADTISYIINSSGIKEYYLADKKTGYERLENLNELISAVTTFEATDQNSSITDFLTHAVLESSADSLRHDSSAESSVQLLTVHAAKGLEFKVIFLVGLEDGLFPHENCLDTVEEIEEERRLMYVAITRAKDKLYLLRACSRLSWGKRQSASLSRFVNEIPGDLISNISGISAIGHSSLLEYGVSSVAEHYEQNLQSSLNVENKISRVTLSSQEMTIKIGDMVKHAKFGNGKVIHLHADGKKLTGEIFFIGVGKKMLDLNIAKIERA